MKLYARAGETVTCENGHPICDFARDVNVGQPISDDDSDLENWRIPKPYIGQYPLPRCTCGAEWVRNMMILHFEDGWRDPLNTMEPA